MADDWIERALRWLACRAAASHSPQAPALYSSTIAEWCTCAVCGEGFWTARGTSVAQHSEGRRFT